MSKSYDTDGDMIKRQPSFSKHKLGYVISAAEMSAIMMMTSGSEPMVPVTLPYQSRTIERLGSTERTPSKRKVKSSAVSKRRKKNKAARKARKRK